MSIADTSPVPCKYGMDCYRQNPIHFRDFSHPTDHPKSLQKREMEASDSTPNCDPVLDDHPPAKLTKTEKLSVQGNRIQNEPTPKFHYKFSRVTNIPDVSYNAHSPSISDILSYRENLERSVQFNYMIDIDWLMRQYRSRDSQKPLLLIHGSQGADKGVKI